MAVPVTMTEILRTIPSEEQLGFGTIFTNHMFVMDYETGKGWHSARIVPYEEFEASPSNMTLHYGQAIFEGIKAFRTEDNRIVVFRVNDYLNRFNRSADHLCIPRINVEEVKAGLFQLLETEKDWVPHKRGTSLYIRPFIIATDPYVGVKVSDTYRLFIILSPVGAYYAAGFNPVSIKVEDKYVRATPGGLGEAKTPANYAMSLRAQVEAKKEGFTQVLWLDAIHRKYIEEVGTMNILFKINGEVITPALNGSILSGITRRTVLEVLRDWGINAVERQISIEEVYEAHAKGTLEEVFGSGTAAVISPVGELSWKGHKITINNNQTGKLAQRLFDYITGLQQGGESDKFGWVETVTKG
ncbi:branched-chain amino acid aminotransferase [Propionispora vibrioides]|jgi:branched-chain amino acid aminotransferase|uniref:branched-chain-amino-acid transaminase n=1 Tax=Propionispora vibrioides TaxID=112903 RepID=A0A1H8WD16_9FIRM|nr:branched-chain amino acid aminotransferase [Propionispora vibrioides]SEP25554.1 branched chain amino acid aminotransferase apoenzyme [Propionispora vibrioides]